MKIDFTQAIRNHKGEAIKTADGDKRDADGRPVMRDLTLEDVALQALNNREYGSVKEDSVARRGKLIWQIGEGKREYSPEDITFLRALLEGPVWAPMIAYPALEILRG